MRRAASPSSSLSPSSSGGGSSTLTARFLLVGVTSAAVAVALAWRLSWIDSSSEDRSSIPLEEYSSRSRPGLKRLSSSGSDAKRDSSRRPSPQSAATSHEWGRKSRRGGRKMRAYWCAPVPEGGRAGGMPARQIAYNF